MSRSQKQLAWCVWILYTLVVFIGIARGGMWLDEMQVWCLGRDHHSVSDLLYTLRNEGHPPLWFLMVYALTGFSASPMSMAVLHGLFALGTAWIVLFRAPWPMVWRIVAVFGYFFLFEYAIMARNYGPGVFFLFAALAAYQARRQGLVMLALMALAMTHYWGLVLAGAWAVAAIATRGTDRAERLRSVAVLVVAALALYLALPSAKLPYAPDVHRMPIAQVPDQFGGILGEVFFPLPDLARPSPWNTGWLMNNAHT
ncbi:MAG TPA: hypothetical protein VHL57_07725, partial [Flavobacteriales bacterium]|nr:hypothetical protein [Flavobacteriales bacterium]